MKQYEITFVRRYYASATRWIEAETEDEAWDKAEELTDTFDDLDFDVTDADADETWVENVQEAGHDTTSTATS